VVGVGVEDERPLDQLHHLAGGLDAGKAAADHREGEQFLLDLRQRGDVGLLELVDDGVSRSGRSSAPSSCVRARRAPRCREERLEGEVVDLVDQLDVGDASDASLQ
jgi:hypothetical protein